ncbi:MAG: exosortase/archaeosortase family protein [Caldilineaceae bacterium]
MTQSSVNGILPFMQRLSFQPLWVPMIATLAFGLLTAPIWHWLWGEWLGNDYYSHGLLIPPVVLFLCIQRFRHDKSLYWKPEQGSNPGLVVLVLCLAAFLYFLNGKAYYLAAFAMVGLLAGLVWVLGGNGVVRRLLFPIGYLMLMIPLPFVERSTLPLALFTGVCSGSLARFLGLDVTIVGNAVTLPNANLVIGAQCSGINSLIALTALMTLAAYLLEGPLWGRLALVGLAVPLAMFGNILRVASLLFVARAYSVDAAFTFYHDYSGIVFFVLVFLLMVPLTRLLQARAVRLDVI